MLVLSRNYKESIVCIHPDGTRIVFTILDIRGGSVRVGTDAPIEVSIMREELQRQIDGLEPRRRDDPPPEGRRWPPSGD